MKAWKELEALVLDGHHGELPNVPRYQFMGRCPTTKLRIFTCIVNSSWVESWHNQQRDSAAYGVGMIWADLMLHCAVDRWNVNAGVKYAGEPCFGVPATEGKDGNDGIQIYDESVIEMLHQVRAAAPEGFFPPDSCDKYASPKHDTGERFGLGWAMREYFSVFSDDAGASKTQQYNAMEKHFEFTATKQGDDVKRLDIEVLATLAGGQQLCEEQEQALTSLEPELAELKRDSVTLDALTRHVCAVLRARPLEPDAAANADTGDATAAGGVAAAAGGAAFAGNTDAAAGNAAAAAVNTGAAAAAAGGDATAGGVDAAGDAAASGTGVTGAAMRVQGRLAAREQRERESKQEGMVLKKLGGVLLDDDSPSRNARAITWQDLDGAFLQYNKFLTASPTALSREWKTGQSVMRAMWELHGQDEEKIFSAIRTRKGIELYVDVVENLSGDNMRKVSARKIAVEWNSRIAAKISEAETEGDKQQIRLEYGFIGEKEAKSHTDRVKLRVDQTQKHASMVDKMIDFCRDVKESRSVVGQLEHPVGLRESMQPGVGGPGANVLQGSALRPMKRAEAPGSSLATAEETKNRCFMCSTNGQPNEECCIKDAAGKYTPGHGRKQKGFLCEFFDGKFPTGDAAANALRERKIKDAARLRGNAMKAFSKRAKLAQETS